MLFDIHTHILPGIDDGSETIETSLEMLKEEELNGVTDVVLTPHTAYGTSQWYTKEELQNFFEKFKEKAKNINVNLHLGSEILVNLGFLRALKAGKLKSIDDSKYMLIEFDLQESEYNILNSTYNLSCYGYTPIIAHPERYNEMNIEIAQKLKSYGALLQMNTSSILGDFGRHIKKKAKKLLKENLIDLISSDCHSMNIRRPNLKKTLNMLEKKYRLTFNNTLVLEKNK